MKKTNAEDFIKQWMKSDTTDEVAQKLGVQTQTVKMRAQDWRKRGVKLPKLTDERKGRTPSVSELNRIIEGYKEN